MPNETVVVDPQKTSTVEEPKTEETVTLSKKELDDLRHKAEVSSQNFERVKKGDEKIKELESVLETLKANPVLSDEEDKIGKLESDITALKQNAAKNEVIETYPALKEVWSDFESFRAEPDNKGMNLKTAAKAFAVEKGLLDPQRKGLERAHGGTRQPIPSAMSPEDVKKLRETNYRKYAEMVQKGQINI